MKRIIFPCTNRVHKARQKLLIKELQKHFVVDIFEPDIEGKADLETFSILSAIQFKNYIAGKEYDLALIRADRFELLLLAGICAYRGVPIVHIEGGASSGLGVIDTRVRNAISALADIHFVTDEHAKKTVSHLTGSSEVFNTGSLDVSFAASIKRKSPNRMLSEPYILFLHHALPGENSETVYDAVKDLGYKVVGVKSNSDYKSSLMHEEYSPEDFISLMYHAKCMVGNSSAICKESSILGTPCVLVGTRQDGRLVGRNVIRSAHNKDEIKLAVEWQVNHARYKPDLTYFQKNTEKTITKILKEMI